MVVPAHMGLGLSVWRFVLAVLAFAVLFAGLSFVINEVWLGEQHEVYAFLRPHDDPRITPGLGITTLLWSTMVTWSYHFFGARIKVANRFVHGAIFGLIVYACFVFFQEFLYYQFIAFEWIIIFGALLHYFLAFSLGCGLVAVISGPPRIAPPTPLIQPNHDRFGTETVQEDGRQDGPNHH